MKLDKLLIGLAVLATAVTVQAEVLYWQVAEGEGDQFTYAQLKTYNSEGGSKSTATLLGTANAANLNPDTYLGTHTDLNQTDVSSYASSGTTQMFFIELYQYSAGSGVQKLRDSYVWSYNDLQSSGYIATDTWGVNSAIAAASAANLGSATPEPTSGMLLLIGGSLLALRRRRRQA